MTYSKSNPLSPPVSDQLYRTLVPIPFKSSNVESSIHRCGLLSPVIACDLPKYSVQLLDGWSRFQAVGTLSESQLVVHSLSDINEFARQFIDCHHHQYESVIQFILTCQALLSLGVSRSLLEEIVTQSPWCPNHPQVLHYMTKIAKLPNSLLSFLHEKRVSFKVLLKISAAPSEILDSVGQHVESMGISASQCVQLVSDVTALFKVSSNKTTPEWIEELKLRMSQCESSRDVTQLLKWVNQFRFKQFYDHETELLNIKNKIDLPETWELSWDDSLEVSQVDLTIPITRRADMDRVQEWFNQPKNQSDVDQLLNNL